MLKEWQVQALLLPGAEIKVLAEWYPHVRHPPVGQYENFCQDEAYAADLCELRTLLVLHSTPYQMPSA
jgi:hypothetical protein